MSDQVTASAVLENAYRLGVEKQLSAPVPTTVPARDDPQCAALKALAELRLYEQMGVAVALLAQIARTACRLDQLEDAPTSYPIAKRLARFMEVRVPADTVAEAFGRLYARGDRHAAIRRWRRLLRTLSERA